MHAANAAHVFSFETSSVWWKMCWKPCRWIHNAFLQQWVTFPFAALPVCFRNTAWHEEKEALPCGLLGSWSARWHFNEEACNADSHASSIWCSVDALLPISLSNYSLVALLLSHLCFRVCSVLLIKYVLRCVSESQETSLIVGTHLFPDLDPHCLAETAKLILLINGNFGMNELQWI